jgi:hypothetical protein
MKYVCNIGMKMPYNHQERRIYEIYSSIYTNFVLFHSTNFNIYKRSRKIKKGVRNTSAR